MSENTAIEWTDSTFNPWEGCQKVGPGCDHCYAETRNARFGGGTAINWGPGAPRRRTSVSNWNLPRRWNAQAEAFFAAHGRRQRVFCSSLADVFDNAVPIEWLVDLFELIRQTPRLDWLLLTKRIGNVTKRISEAISFQGGISQELATWLGDWLDGAPPANVWLGATIVNQEEADREIPKLLAVPAAKRFLSMEPLLDFVAIWRYLTPHCERHPGKLEPDGKCEVCEGRGIWDMPGAEQLTEAEKAPIRPGLDWVIVGGESGPGARPMHPDWARSLRDQCEAAGVPFLFKQWGEWGPMEEFEPFPGVVKAETAMYFVDTDRNGFKRQGPAMIRHGKKAAGRLLDGRTHDGSPITTESIA